jgi:hypothetical protein
LILLACSCVSAQNATPAPPINLNGPAQPAALDANSTLDQILDALHQRGLGLKDFTADVTLQEIDELSGDTSTWTGKTWYQAKGEGDARMRVQFDSKKVGSRVDKEAKVEYMLDKGWLIDRDYKRKIQVDRQVLKPGQKVNLLKLGEGPFPLPIGQPKEDVLKLFEVKKVDPAQEDPPGTVHLQLIPRRDSQFERRFQSIDVWVDTKTNFPRSIETSDRNGTGRRRTELSNIQINQGIGDQQFTLEKVAEGWTMKSEEME